MKTYLPVFRHRALARCTLAALLSLGAGQAGATTFSDTPNIGSAKSYPPNVLLALSVEFPTAGAAYQAIEQAHDYVYDRDAQGNIKTDSKGEKLLKHNGHTTLPLKTEEISDGVSDIPFWKFTNPRSGINAQHPTPGFIWYSLPVLTLDDFKNNNYVGYFNPTKCYSYTGSGSTGYFTPTAEATAEGFCNGSTYSGKAMNWLTMSALDVYRWTMTGGNRAFGLTNLPAAYQNGDTPTLTTLRRAFVNMEYTRNAKGEFTNDNRNGRKGLAERILTKELAERVLPVQNLKFETFPEMSDRPELAAKLGTSQMALRIRNSDFRMALLQQDGKYRLMNVVVEVCKQGFRESNCYNYNGSHKPIGLMQENINKMRFSAFSYLNNSVERETSANLPPNNSILAPQGGVLRARMKSLLGETTVDNIALGAEIRADGSFEINPDVQDAKDSNVSNSGIINYLNKFGDSGTYRNTDPAGELYYAGLRYLMGRPSYDFYNQRAGGVREKDNFPAITNWSDPLLRQGETLNGTNAICRPNYIMYIGDTNVHQDNDVPNFNVQTKGGDGTSNGILAAPSDDNEVQTKTALESAQALERTMFPRGDGNVGANTQNSYGSIVGLAHWARVNDIRRDDAAGRGVKGRQFVRSIFIDVLENEAYKVSGELGKNTYINKNAFYWAAKYGGFDADETELNGGIPAIRSRSQWTTEPVGNSSVPHAYPEGLPKSFALANTPDNMVNALKNAFHNISAKSETPSQAALGMEQNSGELIDLGSNTNAAVLQSTYKKNPTGGWQGDVIARNVTASGYTPKWSFADQLETFRNNTSARKVFSRDDNGRISAFSDNQATAFSKSLQLDKSKRITGSEANLINYLLGESTYETGNNSDAFRTRPVGGLLGTVVNSSVAVLPKPHLNVCGNSNSGFDNLKNRNTVYAFAANDGMLHITDTDGREKFAYIPSTALPKLKDFATTEKHAYINDGTPVVGEMCVNGKHTSVIVGTAGRGGEAVYAVDAGSIGKSGYTPSERDVLWEFTKADDADLGLTLHKTELGTVKGTDGKGVAVAVVSGGYNAARGQGYLYVLKIGKTGAWSAGGNYWKIPLGKTGVGAPKTLDTDNDGHIDRIYVGDEEGKLWRADFANNAWTSKTVFNAGRPITGAPDAVSANGGHTVIFSTGQYFDPSDGTGTAKQQNHAYGLFDKDGSLIADRELLNQKIEPIFVAVQGGRTFYKASSEALKTEHKGWKLALPEGFTADDDAYARRRKVAQFFAFSTIPGDHTSANMCQASGQSALIEVDLRTGGLYHPAKLFDTDGDKNYTANDKPTSMMVSGDTLAMKRSNTTVLNRHLHSAQVKDQVLWVGDTGTIQSVELNALTGIRRLSWREIF